MLVGEVMKNNILDINKLNYNDVFHNFNIGIKKNSFTVIAGSNNTGKTTLIKILSGLINIKKTVKYKDSYLEDINKNTIYKDMAVMFFDNLICFNDITVEDHLFSILDNIKSKNKINTYQEIINLTNITSVLSKNINELSFFDKSRVVLTSLLLTNPKVILIDDVCLGLDKSEADIFLNILYEIIKKKVTVVVTTNNLEYAVKSDYIYLIDSNGTSLEGSPSDVLILDNNINKLGLNVPFMYDLSVKLRDYNLTQNIELDIERLVDTLWK